MGTQVATAVQQGASNFRCVRVTDGTDIAADLRAVLRRRRLPAAADRALHRHARQQHRHPAAAGSQAGTWRLTLTLPGLTPEVFDNIAAPTPGGLLGQPRRRREHRRVRPARPEPARRRLPRHRHRTAPQSLSNQTLFGGTDGATAINAATLVGADTLPRRGLYALRGQGCSLALLADADDPTQYTSRPPSPSPKAST